MAVSYNTGTTATLDNVPRATAFTFTVPAGVTAGDVMIVSLQCFTFTSAAPAVAAPASGGGAWTQIGTLQDSGAAGGVNEYATAWRRTATGPDPGSTFTVSFTGPAGSTDGFYWAAALASYAGVSASAPVDVQAGRGQLAGTTAATPAATTGAAGDWAVYLGSVAPGIGTTITAVPAGSTQRQNVMSALGVGTALADSGGSAGPAGTGIGGGTFSVGAFGSPGPWWGTFTIGLAAAVTVPSVTFVSTDGNNVSTYSVTWAGNGAGSQNMRVLPPSAPNPARPHAFLWMLPVEPGQGTTFGDSITTARTIGAHNAYNLTVIQPGYGIDPWYADNPSDPAVQQETFTLDLITWAQANLATTGTEQHYLIGFSKSGLGGQGLIFRHPAVFARCASWDAPFMMTDYDGTDPTFGSTVGGGPAAAYGTSGNFTGNYQLSSAHLTTWKNASTFGTVNRIWTGGFSAFAADVSAYSSLLTSTGIQHTSTWSVNESHAWHTDWVAAALAVMLPAPAGLLTASFP